MGLGGGEIFIVYTIYTVAGPRHSVYPVPGCGSCLPSLPPAQTHTHTEIGLSVKTQTHGISSTCPGPLVANFSSCLTLRCTHTAAPRPLRILASWPTLTIAHMLTKQRVPSPRKIVKHPILSLVQFPNLPFPAFPNESHVPIHSNPLQSVTCYGQPLLSAHSDGHPPGCGAKAFLGQP